MSLDSIASKIRALGYATVGRRRVALSAYADELEAHAAAERALRKKLEGLAEKWENEERFQLSIDGHKYAEQLRGQLKGS